MLSGTGKKQLLLIVLFLAAVTGLHARELSLSAELEQDQIWLGDSVRLTLYLQGSEKAISPELFIPDVDIEPLGGTVRSSRSVTNINGHVTETVRKAYVYNFRLTPETSGRITVPGIEVEVDGIRLVTKELNLNVKRPQATNDFSLELQYEKDKIFLDELCRLKVSFFYSRSLRSLDIRIPGLEEINYEGTSGSPNDERYEINLNGSPVVFSRDDRGNTAGLSAVLVLHPDEAGVISLYNASASFEGVTGYQNVQDFFGRIQQQEVYDRMVIPGNRARAEVEPFPVRGQPDDFFGLSGNISLDVSIEPREVHIGDPVTLNLKVSGMNNPEIVIPELGSYLGRGIDVPDTRSSAKIAGNTCTVTQTIRINDISVEQVPPIKFSYFNTETEEYEYAVSAAVPVKVLDTRVLTASELEGSAVTADEVDKVLLERKREGIYYNYSGKDLLEPDVIMIERLTGSAGVKILLIIPPIIFLIIIIYTAVLPQVKARAAERASRGKEIRKLKKSAMKGNFDSPLESLREFNGALNAFLKIHGTPEDKKSIKDFTERINSVLYGRVEITAGQAREIVADTIVTLEKQEAVNV